MVSWRGLCFDCSSTAVLQSNESLAAKSGPHYERWRQGVDAAVIKRAERIFSQHFPADDDNPPAAA